MRKAQERLANLKPGQKLEAYRRKDILAVKVTQVEEETYAIDDTVEITEQKKD